MTAGWLEALKRWIAPFGSKEGQALVEYALILALVAIAAIVGLHFLGQTAQNTLNNVANTVSNG